MTENTAPANGDHTTNGIPHGSTSLTPFLAVKDARNALNFYRDIFGARIVDVTEMGGAIAHAVLDFGNGQLQIGEPNPEYHLIAPSGGEDHYYSMGLYCPNVDEVVERAVAAGSTVREPTTHFVSGDRYASIIDPFGVRWSILTRVEDLSEAESIQRVAEWAAQFHQGE